MDYMFSDEQEMVIQEARRFAEEQLAPVVMELDEKQEVNMDGLRALGELGYLGIAHRPAVVAQSSRARHDHLLQGYLAALDATRTGLHIINTGLRPESKLVPLNAWLVAGAAIESRAHPFFRINPAAGDAAALRMNFERNPQPEVDWPIHPFRYQDENGNLADRELAFTFADYALLIDRLRHHFRLR